MSEFAVPQDVEAIWRPLSEPETARVETLLEYASGLIRQAVPQVDGWLADGTLAATSVRYVAAQMVYRFMLNPEGRRQQARAVDDYSESWTLQDVAAAGGLVLSADLLPWLRPPAVAAAGGAFTIRPGAPERAVTVPDARRR